MKIECIILTSNRIIDQKFSSFFLNTPFFNLKERGPKAECDLLIWDVDSINIDEYTDFPIEAYNCSLIIMVTSYYSQFTLSYKMRYFPESWRVFYMRKAITYNSFIQELDEIIQRLNAEQLK